MKIERTNRGAKTRDGLFVAIEDERNARGHAHVARVVGTAQRAMQLGAVRVGHVAEDRSAEGVDVTRWQIAAANGSCLEFDLVERFGGAK